MNIILKIFCIVLYNTVFANITVNAFNTKHLYISTVNGTKPEFLRMIAYDNPNGIKVVSNNANSNTKKREGQVANPQPKNSIKEIREENDGVLSVVAEIADDKTEINIAVFNMLGKEVRKIFQGIPTEKNDEGHYVFTSEKPLNLPKNVYILVIQGNTFKIADRFITVK
jgi:hypothetical protein